MVSPRLRVLAGLLALAQPLDTALAEASAASTRAHPALWRLRDHDTTIYLFGTIHALPPHFEWESPPLRAVIAKSDMLVLEAVIDRDSSEAAQALLTLGAADRPLPPLAQRVPQRYRARLETMAQKAGWPLDKLDGFKTWAAAMILFGVTVAGLGVSSADGVEEQLKDQFAGAGKPVEGLETLAQQLGFFNSLGETQQRAFLQSVLDDDSHDAADFGKMLGAWARGNEAGIQRSFAADMKSGDPLSAVLLSRRNRSWATLLAQRLKQPGTQFVAVGAGHLVGRQSVLVMLRRAGLHPVRVQ